MEKMYAYDQFFWFVHEGFYENVAAGPYCRKCRSSMSCDVNTDDPFEPDDIEGRSNIHIICDNLQCLNKIFSLHSISKLKSAVVASYNARRRESYEVEALDIPPGKVSEKDSEDKDYWVSASMGQHKGAKMGVVYFGDKVKRDKKAQLFLDFEDELVRFDKGDRNPMDIAAKITVEFPNSRQTFTKRREVDR